MLRAATLWLAAQGYEVMATGRNASRLDNLRAQSKSITTLPCDYGQLEEFISSIRQSSSEQSQPGFDLVLAWIHGDDEPILKRIAELIEEKPDTQWKLFHVLGSSGNVDAIRKKIQMSPRCNYFQIQLGFKLEGNFSRWLSNEEISAGTIASMREEKNVLVGQLEPWEDRP